MGFGKLLLSLLFKIRDYLQSLFIKSFEKFKDPSTGKLTGVNPTAIPKILMTIALLFFAIIVGIKIFTAQNNPSGGIEDFRKELNPKGSVNSRPEDLVTSQSDIVNALNQYDSNSNTDKSNNNNSINNALNDLPLSASECLDLVEKMKKNTKLTDVETAKANQCISENPMGLSTEDLQIAQKMLDPTISEAEKAFLAKGLAGELTPEQRQVALALSGNDPDRAKQAAEAIKSGNPDLITALGKQFNNEPLTDEEKKLIAGMNSGTSTTSDSVTNAASNLSDLKLPAGADTEGALKTITQDVAAREMDIKSKESEITQNQIRAADAAAKLSKGQDISEGEVKLLENFTKNKKSLEALKAVQEERKKELARRWVKMQKTLSESTATIGRIMPSGVFIEYEGGDQIDCKNVKPLPIKKKVKKKVEAKYVDLDNRPLKPEEVEYIKILKKKSNDGTLAKNNAVDFINQLGQPLAAAGPDGASPVVDTAQLFAFKDASLKQFEISPDTKVPAQLESEILTTDKGGSQQVRIRILDDIYDAENNNLIIPKGALALAMTNSGFDAENGIMNISIDKVSFGGKTIAAKFIVGSGDGQMGLRGEVRDTQWKYLAGAFITSFTGGALSYFSQQVIQPFQTSTVAGQALTGAALGGSAEVLNRLAEIYSSKLQSAPKVFWVPKGVPLVLFPASN